jgi:hypothetical protein
MKEIKLTQDKVALVDDEDYEEVSAFNWHAFRCGKTFYAQRYKNCRTAGRRCNLQACDVQLTAGAIHNDC